MYEFWPFVVLNFEFILDFGVGILEFRLEFWI